MKHSKSITIGSWIAVGALLSTTLADWQDRSGSAAQSEPAMQSPAHGTAISTARQETATVPAGTMLTIRLTEGLSLDRQSTGNQFAALLYGPLIVDENYLAPSRSKVIGQLIRDGERGQSADNSRLAIVLRKLIVHGREFDLDTEPVPVSVSGLRRRNGGIGAVAYEPNEQLTFTLSRAVELPIIRLMNISSGAKSMKLRSELRTTKAIKPASNDTSKST